MTETKPTSETTMEFLTRCGKSIGIRADNGHEGAKQIIKLYQMYYDCPSDPGALGLLGAATDEYRKEFPDG